MDNKNLEQLNESLEVVNEEVDYSNEDVLSTNLSDDDVNSLTIEESQIVAQKIEVEIERYENILIDGEDKNLTDEEIIANGFDEEKYYNLKSLEKKIYAHMKKIRKSTKEGGFFGVLPTWAFVLFIICALFTITPVNPYLPIMFYSASLNEYSSDFMLGVGGVYLAYFLYLGVFVITELVLLIILFIKGRKAKEKMQSFKSYLVLFIINILIDIPGLIIFLNAATSFNG